MHVPVIDLCAASAASRSFACAALSSAVAASDYDVVNFVHDSGLPRGGVCCPSDDAS